jgi:hypothetical protein
VPLALVGAAGFVLFITIHFVVSVARHLPCSSEQASESLHSSGKVYLWFWCIR